VRAGNSAKRPTPVHRQGLQVHADREAGRDLGMGIVLDGRQNRQAVSASALVWHGYSLCSHGRLAGLAKITLHLHQKLEISVREFRGRHPTSLPREICERSLNSMRGLYVVGCRMRIRSVVVVRLNLSAHDEILEGRDGHRTGKFLAPSPDQIHPAQQYRGKGIDILVPCAIEIAKEKQIIVLKIFLGLLLAQPREGVARHDDPARKMDERQLHQAIPYRFVVSPNKEEQAQDVGFPRLHRRHCVHRVGFAVDVGHGDRPCANRIRGLLLS
jgi:hypothetical protein